jgi:hypothetical protein
VASEARDGVKKTGEQPFTALPQFYFYAVISGRKVDSRSFSHLIIDQSGDFHRFS